MKHTKKAPSKFSRKFVAATIAKEKQYVRSYGGMCLSEPDSTGFQGVGLGLKTRDRRALVEEVARCLITYKYDWSFLHIVFYMHDGEKKYAFLTQTYDDVTSAEFDRVGTAKLDEFWETFPEDERISTGWVTCPDKDVDLTLELDEAIEYFRENNAWDMDVVQTKMEVKRLKELSLTDTIKEQNNA